MGALYNRIDCIPVLFVLQTTICFCVYHNGLVYTINYFGLAINGCRSKERWNKMRVHRISVSWSHSIGPFFHSIDEQKLNNMWWAQHTHETSVYFYFHFDHDAVSKCKQIYTHAILTCLNTLLLASQSAVHWHQNIDTKWIMTHFNATQRWNWN